MKMNALDDDNNIFFSMYHNAFNMFNLKAHNWQNWKSIFLPCPCTKILQGRCSLSKNFQLYFKSYHFYEYVKFGVISGKFDIFR